VTHAFRYLLLLIVISLGFQSPASANDASSIGPQIVEFFQEPDTAALLNKRQLGLEDPIVGLMQELAESVYASDNERLRTAIETITRTNPRPTPVFSSAIAFAEGALEILETSPDETLVENLIQHFDTYDQDDDWYIRSVSQSLAAFLYISRNQLLLAAERVDNALHAIPTELSSRVTAARLLASEGAVALHGMQGNPTFMLEAARLQKEVKAEIGESVNRHELMTNFVYALNRIRDFEGAALVAELLLREPRPDGVVPGVAEAYIAQSYNELERYSEAQLLAERNLAEVSHPVVLQRSKFALIIALSGLGQETKARKLMEEQGWTQSSEDLLTEVNQEAIIHAEALLAMHRHETAFAMALMNRRADLIIGRVQSANSAGMTDMLSNLENTRERQAERANALQREAEMRAVQLEQKTKLNRLLWVLIGFLTIAFNFLLAFLRYREKLNVKVQELQEDALSAEKMKTEFLGIINHELRTPLNGIIGISDAMIHHAPSQIMREQATAVQASGQLLFDLLDSLITMSTIESDRLTLDAESAQLSKTIANEAADWTGAAEAKGIEFTAFIGTELDDPVVTDHKRIRQCLRYLLSNAVRFTHAGRVHLHATGAQDSAGMMAVTIIVADTGQGISEAVQKRLFKPFLQADATMTRKYGGAGLSLAITRKLAEMMGGDVTVKSREGRGSEFTFTAKLPMAEVAQADIDDTELAQTVSGMAEADSPEAIIDLMLEQQLPAAASAQQPRFKAVG